MSPSVGRILHTAPGSSSSPAAALDFPSVLYRLCLCSRIESIDWQPCSLASSLLAVSCPSLTPIYLEGYLLPGRAPSSYT